jgi:3-(3-hydroxy-phenyl)propionate hydroxylase
VWCGDEASHRAPFDAVSEVAPKSRATEVVSASAWKARSRAAPGGMVARGRADRNQARRDRGRTAPESLLDTYHAERHPVAARVLQNTMAQVALRRPDDRTKALRDTMSELLGMDEPRKRFAAEMSGLGIHYDLGEGHPLLGRRMPDLDLVTANSPLRVFALLHDARPVLLNLGEPGGFDITPWADRVRLIDAKYAGKWELPVFGGVTASTAVLIRPDGYVAWVGDLTHLGLPDALSTWFGPPAAA